MAARRTSPRGDSGPAERAPSSYPRPVDELIAQFARLPGIGRRTAERLAFHVLKSSKEEALGLSRAIAEVKSTVRHCAVCFNFAEGDRCRVCEDERRDASTVLVVEQPRDVLALEAMGMYRGVYHVLMGRLSPLDGVGPGDLTIADLVRRVAEPPRNSRAVRVEEVILGLNPTLEGDGTALHLAAALQAQGVAVSRLARGLASGSSLEAAHKSVLADALEGRQRVV